MFKDSSEVLKFIKDEDVKFLDIRFTDLPGVQQHFNIPASTVDEDSPGAVDEHTVTAVRLDCGVANND